MSDIQQPDLGQLIDALSAGGGPGKTVEAFGKGYSTQEDKLLEARKAALKQKIDELTAANDRTRTINDTNTARINILKAGQPQPQFNKITGAQEGEFPGAKIVMGDDGMVDLNASMPGAGKPVPFGTPPPKPTKEDTAAGKAGQQLQSLDSLWKRTAGARATLDKMQASRPFVTGGMQLANKYLPGEGISKFGASTGLYSPEETSAMGVYESAKPATAVGIYRFATGDTRLSDKDAEQRAFPLVPNYGKDTKDVLAWKNTFITYLLSNPAKPRMVASEEEAKANADAWLAQRQQEFSMIYGPMGAPAVAPKKKLDAAAIRRDLERRGIK